MDQKVVLTEEKGGWKERGSRSFRTDIGGKRASLLMAVKFLGTHTKFWSVDAFVAADLTSFSPSVGHIPKIYGHHTHNVPPGIQDECTTDSRENKEAREILSPGVYAGTGYGYASPSDSAYLRECGNCYYSDDLQPDSLANFDDGTCYSAAPKGVFRGFGGGNDNGSVGVDSCEKAAGMDSRGRWIEGWLVFRL